MSIKIILHVGTEKTGSTSIQHMLFNNKKALKDQGFLFSEHLGYPCNFHLTACALQEYPLHPLRQLLGLHDDKQFRSFRKKTLNLLKTEISQSDCHTLIISDEHINMHLLKNGALETYKDFLDEQGSVEKVILYLRRQDEFRLSLFSEAVKAGNIRGFDADNPMLPFKVIPDRFNYLKIIDRLSDMFGRDRLNLRIFRRDELADGNVVKDFILQSGLPALHLDLSGLHSNPSLDGRIVRGLIEMTRILQSCDDSNADHIRQFLLNCTQAVFKGPGANISYEQRLEFNAPFKDMDDRIKTLYFPDRQAPLFAPISKRACNKDTPFYPEGSLNVKDILTQIAQELKNDC